MPSRLFTPVGAGKYVVFTKDADSKVIKFCDEQESNIWLASDINLTHDLHQWSKLNQDDQEFIKQVLAYFAASDGLVGDNIATNFVNQVANPEVRYFYYMQMMMEGVHAKTYSQLINTFVPTIEERDRLFNSLETIPMIKKKGDWALKWMEKNNNFFERMAAFLAIEGIFFAGAFASIFWLRDRGLMANSLGVANEYISRDESLHANFAAFLINEYAEDERPSNETITEILLTALEIEKDFVRDILPNKLLGMNKELMMQYLEFVTDTWLTELKCPKVFNAQQPFAFMSSIGQRRKDNIFEKSRTNYARNTVSKTLDFSML
jgi:ribonucleoside-diphosphate reductase beta chain